MCLCLHVAQCDHPVHGVVWHAGHQLIMCVHSIVFTKGMSCECCRGFPSQVQLLCALDEGHRELVCLDCLLPPRTITDESECRSKVLASYRRHCCNSCSNCRLHITKALELGAEKDMRDLVDAAEDLSLTTRPRIIDEFGALERHGLGMFFITQLLTW